MKPGSPNRNEGMDFLRTLAILAMMAAHTSRLIVFDVRQEWSRWVLLLEPLIPSGFLFLVGLSLERSQAAAVSEGVGMRSWYVRQLRRAAWLWLISAVFFSLEEGVRFPDVIVASGILCSIAYAILLVGGCLAAGRHAAWLSGFFLMCGSAVFVFLDRAGESPFFLLSGNSPVFPLLLFALAGALWGLGMRDHPRLYFGLGIVALCGAAGLFSLQGWEELFSQPLGRSNATRVLAAPFYGGNARSVPYYNLRPILALTCIAFHIGLISVVGAALRPLRLSPAWSARLFTLGRHSLENYVLHLFLLGLLVVGLGPRPLTATWQGNATLLGIAVVCQVWSMLRERGRTRYRGTQSLDSGSDISRS